MGRITASRKQLVGDPVYGSLLASKFINCLMFDGKKSIAQEVFYNALAEIEKKVRASGDKLDLDMKEDYSDDEDEDDALFDVKIDGDGDNA